MKNEVLNYFKKISSIPRPSGHEEKIADYLVSFAKEHNFEYYRDNSNNVIIKKPTNVSGNDKTLILQSHTDMVCEKNDRTDFDFFTQGIKLKFEDDFIMADGTTLGADNGVGVAMILALLSDPEVEHPNIEAVFTSEEETTMGGAQRLDYSKIKGKHLLSLDGADEGNVEISSAGFLELYCEYPVKFIEDTKTAYEVKITGLMGGHSGEQIHTPRLNAIKALVEAITPIKNKKLCNINCNSKINAIPREASVIFVTDDSCTKENIENIVETYKTSHNDFEKELEFSVNIVTVNNYIDSETTDNLLAFINNYKNAVLEYDTIDPNFPITSCNLANIKIEDNVVKFRISVRSSKKTSEKFYTDKIIELATKHNIKSQIVDTNPFYERKENPYLTLICANAYEKLYNKKSVVKGIHAGLEGGIFSQNIPDIEICTIAPNIYNLHSPLERASLSSIDRTYEWVKQILKDF